MTFDRKSSLQYGKEVMMRELRRKKAGDGLMGILRLLAIVLAAPLSYGQIDEGWTVGKSAVERGNELIWKVPYENSGSLQVEWRDGATGKVSTVSRAGKTYLGIKKLNDIGQVVVKAVSASPVSKGARLQAVANCEADNADPEYSCAFLAVWTGEEDLSDKTTKAFGRGGPRMTQVVNTPPGESIFKLAHGVAGSEGLATTAIVVAGKASTSLWSNWAIEDLDKAEKKWVQRIRERKPPAEDDFKVMDKDEFDEFLARSADHTAKVAKVGGYSTFFIDGEKRVPIFYKSIASNHSKGYIGGSRMSSSGMDLQTVSLRLGATKYPSQGKGYWSAQGFDVTGAVERIRRQMAKAPNAKYLLSLGLAAYPEFCDQHPQETWINDYGQRVFGHQCHSPFRLPKEKKNVHWYWPSVYSELWHSATKARLTELVDALKRSGLSKLIVGVHLSGYHDGQFATVHPDYSPSACKAFRRHLKSKYGTPEKLRKSWNMPNADFDNAQPVRLRHVYGHHPYLMLPQDRPAADYLEFLKRGPFAVQEMFARHLKKEFGKPIVAVRYCMSFFGGSFCGAYDIEPFLESDAIDILCAQPNYGRRVPGVPMTCRLPLASFHQNGKMYFDEFDLRTYGAMTFWETEVATLSYSQAADDRMFSVINRKLAGQMLAGRMGWWYYDMAGGWFHPEGILSDISETVSSASKICGQASSPWHGDVAFVMDESGALLRNTLSQYDNPDETMTTSHQLESLAAAGVPVDKWMMSDWLKHPELSDRYRMIVFFGLYNIDDERKRLLERIRGRRRTLVFMSGCGVSAGMKELGFGLSHKVSPARHETTSTDPSLNMNSLFDVRMLVRFMGVDSGWPWHLNSPTRFFLDEQKDQKVLARFAEDGRAAVAERRTGNTKEVYVAAFGGFSPDYFRKLALECDAYVPFDKTGLQVDMNGNFISVHCLKAGMYNFRLPFRASLVNLKTKKLVGSSLLEKTMEFSAGETRWYLVEK
jgi:hypothetical protein